VDKSTHGKYRYLEAVLRIRDRFIPDPGSAKNLRIFNPRKLSKK
jgi:hypothetical protein